MISQIVKISGVIGFGTRTKREAAVQKLLKVNMMVERRRSENRRRDKCASCCTPVAVGVKKPEECVPGIVHEGQKKPLSKKSRKAENISAENISPSKWESTSDLPVQKSLTHLEEMQMDILRVEFLDLISVLLKFKDSDNQIPRLLGALEKRRNEARDQKQQQQATKRILETLSIRTARGGREKERRVAVGKGLLSNAKRRMEEEEREATSATAATKPNEAPSCLSFACCSVSRTTAFHSLQRFTYTASQSLTALHVLSRRL
uniref:Uncharacterized protein n=1 Tax=Setaria digitata TaxID=48799 RepID=A0A915PQB5_9BILA